MNTYTYTAGSGSGSTYKADNSSWNNVYNQTTGDGAAYNFNGQDEWVRMLKSGTYYEVDRTYLSINTSDLPDDIVIKRASLFVYIGGSSNADSATISICKGNQASGTALAKEDHGSFGTEYATKAISAWSAGWNEIVLPSSMFSDISKTGYTKFCLRIKTDNSSTAPTGSNSIYISFTNDAYIVIKDFDTTTKTTTAKANIQLFTNTTRTITSKSDIFNNVSRTMGVNTLILKEGTPSGAINAKADILATQTQTISSVARVAFEQSVFAKSSIIRSARLYPTLNNNILTCPSSSSREYFMTKAEILTICGKTRWDIMNRKYVYKLNYEYISVEDYDALESLVNTLVAQNFVWGKYASCSGNGVSVLAELSDRQPNTPGDKDSGFYSKVTLTLTEVSSRI